ncbi:hypothetical protein QF028_003326 [Neobacillus sp. B4I6]|jgi:hypothetical protein
MEVLLYIGTYLLGALAIVHLITFTFNLFSK